MTTGEERWRLLQQKAQRLINGEEHSYYTLQSQTLTKNGGVYIIFLKEEDGNEFPLFIGHTHNLSHEILLKRDNFLLGNLGNKMVWENSKPKILSMVEFLAYLEQNCYIRFIEESNESERMGIVVTTTVLLKPEYWEN